MLYFIVIFTSIQVIKMLVSILILFIIYWTPRVLQSFSLGFMRWSGFDPASYALDENEMLDLTMVLRMLSYVNSIVNVVIYYITSK